MGAQLSEEWIAYWKLSRKVPQGVNQDDFECALADLALAGLRASVKESLTVHPATAPAERRSDPIGDMQYADAVQKFGHGWERRSGKIRRAAVHLAETITAMGWPMEERIGHWDRRKGGSQEGNDCRGSSDPEPQAMVSGKGQSNQLDERRTGNPEDAGSSAPAHGNDRDSAPADLAERLPPEGSDLLKLGMRLADLLDDDHWNEIEPMLLRISAATEALEHQKGVLARELCDSGVAWAGRVEAFAAENAELKAQSEQSLKMSQSYHDAMVNWMAEAREAEARGHAVGFAEAKGYVAKHVQVMLTACDAGDFGDVEYSRAYVEGIVEEIESLQPRKEAKG